MNRVQQPPKMRRHSRRLHVQRGKVRNELLNARGHRLERRLLSCGVPAPRGDTVASNCRHLPDGGVSPSHIAPAESPEGGQAPSSADAVATPPHSALRPRDSAGNSRKQEVLPLPVSRGDMCRGDGRGRCLSSSLAEGRSASFSRSRHPGKTPGLNNGKCSLYLKPPAFLQLRCSLSFN